MKRSVLVGAVLTLALCAVQAAHSQGTTRSFEEQVKSADTVVMGQAMGAENLRVRQGLFSRREASFEKIQVRTTLKGSAPAYIYLEREGLTCCERARTYLLVLNRRGGDRFVSVDRQAAIYPINP